MGLARFGGGWFILEEMESTDLEVCKSQESAQGISFLLSLKLLLCHVTYHAQF